MADLHKYLAESEKTYEFRFKAACELSDEQIDKMETHLRKYEAYDISSPKRTILQSAPLDFYDHKPSEIYIIDFKTKLPMPTKYALDELVQKMGVAERDVRLVNVNEPREIENDRLQNKDDSDYKAKLLDDEYSDAEDVNADDYHGEAHLTKFMKELQDSKREMPTEIKESALRESSFNEVDVSIKEAYMKLEEASALLNDQAVSAALRSSGVDAAQVTALYDSLANAADQLSDIMSELGTDKDY